MSAQRRVDIAGQIFSAAMSADDEHTHTHTQWKTVFVINENRLYLPVPRPVGEVTDYFKIFRRRRWSFGRSRCSRRAHCCGGSRRRERSNRRTGRNGRRRCHRYRRTRVRRITCGLFDAYGIFI